MDTGTDNDDSFEETSDAEELELLRAESPRYWSTYASHRSPNGQAPRKRPKIDHTFDEESTQQSTSPTSPVLSTSLGPSLTRVSSPATTPPRGKQYSPLYFPPSPEDVKKGLASNGEDESDDELLLKPTSPPPKTPSKRLRGNLRPMLLGPRSSPSRVGESPRIPALMRALSLSPTKARAHTSPEKEPLFENGDILCPVDQNVPLPPSPPDHNFGPGLPLFTPHASPSRPAGEPYSSPLSPLTSPGHLNTPPPPSSRLSGMEIADPGDDFPLMPLSPPPAPPSPPVFFEEPGRYPLRERTARQQKPFTTELREYKWSLKNNRGAIVPSAQTREGGSARNERYQGTQDESQAGWQPESQDVERDEEEERAYLERQRRRAEKGKGRAERNPSPTRADKDPTRHDASSFLLPIPDSDEDEDVAERNMRRDREVVEKRMKAQKDWDKQQKKREKDNEKLALELQKAQEDEERERKRRKKRFPLKKTFMEHTSSGENVPSPRPPLSAVTSSPTHAPASLPGSSLPTLARSRAFPSFSPMPGRDTSPQQPNFDEFYNDDDMLQDTPPPPEPEIEIPSSEEEEGQDEPADAAVRISKAERLALRRMGPTVWLNKVIKPVVKPRRLDRSPSPGSGSQAEEVGLRPGQARVRKAPPGNRKVAALEADSETSDEDRHLSDRDSDVQVVNGPVALARNDRHIGRKRAVAVYKRKENSEASNSGSSSEDSNVDDIVIEDWFKDDPPPRSEKRERMGEQLIDFMLSKTRTLGKRRPTPPPAVSSGKKRKRVSGVGTSHSQLAAPKAKHAKKQTTLPFDRANQPRASTSTSHRSRGTASPSRRSDRPSASKQARKSTGEQTSRSSATPRASRPRFPSDNEVELEDLPARDDQEIVQVEPVDRKALAAARKKKKKDAAAKKGVYVVNSGTHHIQSKLNVRVESPSPPPRRRRLKKNKNKTASSKVVVDLGVQDLRDALAPTRKDGPRPRAKVPFAQPPKESLAPRRRDADTIVDHWEEEEEEDDSDDVPEPPAKYTRTIKAGLRITPLGSGIMFDGSTYLGQGQLHELIAIIVTNAAPEEPFHCSAHDFEFGPETTIVELVDAFPRFCKSLCELADAHRSPRIEKIDEWWAPFVLWERLMRCLCRLVHWLPLEASSADFAKMQTVVQSQVSLLVGHLQAQRTADGPNDQVTFSVCLFSIDITARLEQAARTRNHDFAVETATLSLYMQNLIRHLWAFNLSSALESVRVEPGELNARTSAQRAAQAWICLVHLTIACYRDAKDSHPLLMMVLEIAKDVKPWSTNLDDCEELWGEIFTLCAFGQFSVHGVTSFSKFRITACWDMVDFILKHAQLAAPKPEQGRFMSKHSAHLRDDYICVQIARCFIMVDRWKWKLESPVKLLNTLSQIFQSRKFANLEGETADFGAFLLKQKLNLLHKFNKDDKSFEMFLKLIVRADTDSRPDGGACTWTNRLAKLISMALPIGNVPFTREKPPTEHELSRLFNRYNAIAVAIYLDPTGTKLDERVRVVRGYVDFKKADNSSRDATIRGWMHLGSVVRGLKLSMNGMRDWLGSMTQVLLEEAATLQRPEQRTRREHTVLRLQLLSGAVRQVSVVSVEGEDYPDISLIDGPWVTSVLDPAKGIVTSAKIAHPVRDLLKEFLKARSAAMYPPMRPAVSQEVESQDDYAAYDMEYDLADPNYAQDSKSCELFLVIVPFIYRLVSMFCSQRPKEDHIDEFFKQADEWIDVWVGCVAVLVHHGKKTWAESFDLGRESWDRIMDATLRRRVGLRFMCTLLRLNPMAYKDHHQRFIGVLLESLVSSRVTIEHQFSALLLSVDGLKHPLLEGFKHPSLLDEEGRDYVLSHEQFGDIRMSLLKHIVEKLALRIHEETHGQPELRASNQVAVGSVVAMFSVMKDSVKIDGQPMHAPYLEFCREVVGAVQGHAGLCEEPRLKALLETLWTQSLAVVVKD